jgi:AsmA protein
MKTIFRYLVIGVVAAIAFLVAIVVIFTLVFDANEYKQDLSDLVQEKTGRVLQFHGDVSLTVFPALGMKLGAMSFSNPPSFGVLPMIKVKEASISVDLASLIRFSPEIEKLVLRDLEVNLITNKVGVTNWDDLTASAGDGESVGTTGSGSTETNETGSSQAESTQKESTIPIEGAFGGLDLQNIKLLWLDEQAGQEYRINDLDISTGRIVPNKSFPITMHLDASGSGDVKVMLDFKSDIEFLIEQQQLTLENITLALNEYQIAGRLQLSDFNKPTPTLRFDLESPELDVDALTGTEAADSAGPATPASTDAAATEAAADTQIQLPMQTLRDLDIDGKLKIALIKMQNLKMSDVDITIKVENGIVGIRPLTLNTYGGKVEASVVIDARGNLPKYGVNKSVQGIQIGDLLKDYSGTDAISGTLNAEVNLATSGEWISKLKSNSNGSMNLEFLDGALNGFNIRHSIDTAKARFSGDDPPPEETLKTDFSSLTVSGVIKNGVFSSNDLDMQAPLLRVSGAGSANLVKESVDYRVNAKLVGSVEGQQGDDANKLSGLEIPVRIKGPFADPKIDVQLDEMLKSKAAAAKAKLKADIEAQKEALKKEIEAEKKALAESKKKELEKKMEVEKAKAKAKLKKKKEELLKKLTE